jgi:hypothetical protein
VLVSKTATSKLFSLQATKELNLQARILLRFQERTYQRQKSPLTLQHLTNMELVVQSFSFNRWTTIWPQRMLHSLTSWIPALTCLSHMDQVSRKVTLVATRLSSWSRPEMTTLKTDNQVAMNSKSRSSLLKINLNRSRLKFLIEMMEATWSLTKLMSHAKSTLKSCSRMTSRSLFQ